jgi:hypothetical protein
VGWLSLRRLPLRLRLETLRRLRLRWLRWLPTLPLLLSGTILPSYEAGNRLKGG